MRYNLSLIIGCIGIFILLLITFAFPYLPVIDHELNERAFRMVDGKPFGAPFPPSAGYPLGSDERGRDYLSLIVMGAKETLLVILIIAIIRYLAAFPLAVYGFRSRSWISWVIVKWNQALTNLPTIFMVAVIIYIPFINFSENRMLWVILIIALIETGRVSYILQEQMQQISSSPSVEAGIAVGNSQWGLYRRYYLPVMLPQLVVNFTLDISKIMLLLGQMGFFAIFINQTYIIYDVGIGMHINQSIAWPQLLANVRHNIYGNIWIPIVPALTIAFTVVTFHTFGEGLRNFFERSTISKYNPRLERKVMREIQAEKRKQEEVTIQA